MKIRHLAPCLAIVAGLTCFSAGPADAQDSKSEYFGKWASSQARFKFDKVNSDGTLVGSCKLLEGRWKGWLVTFTGKLDKDGVLTLNRTDKVNAKGAPDPEGTTVKQMSQAGPPTLIDDVWFWRGRTTHHNVADTLFELRVIKQSAHDHPVLRHVPQVATAVKVVSLFAIDDDPTTKHAGSITAAGDLALSILHTHCPNEHRTSEKTLHMDRSPGDGETATKPSDVLGAIRALKTTANDVIFVYACCHGNYFGDDQYLFMSKGDDDALTGLKRADVVAALRVKPSHAVVFLTDACSASLTASSPGTLGDTDNHTDRLYRIFASLPRGTFLDVNTSSKGQISGLNADGGIATGALCWALENPSVTSWDALQTAWQGRLSTLFQKLRGEALNDASLGDSEKKAYVDQTDQMLDVKRTSADVRMVFLGRVESSWPTTPAGSRLKPAPKPWTIRSIRFCS